MSDPTREYMGTPDELPRAADLLPKRCPRCVAQYGATGRPRHFGSDPRCAFRDGVFTRDNWNCATANALRGLCPDSWWGEHPTPGVFSWRDDNAAASFGALWVPEYASDDEELSGAGFYVAMSWYKSRGATGQAWVFSDDAEPHALTLREADYAIRSIEAWRATASAGEAL